MRAPVLVSLAFAAACASTPARTPDAIAAEEIELRNRVVQYYQAFSARQWASYRDFFWPGATLTTVWQPPGEPEPRVVVTSMDQFLANTAQGPDSKPIFEERLRAQDVRLLGNVAHVWAHYEARFGDSTAVDTWRGVDAFTWMKHKGQWRIVAMAYTDEPGETRGPP